MSHESILQNADLLFHLHSSISIKDDIFCYKAILNYVRYIKGIIVVVQLMEVCMKAMTRVGIFLSQRAHFPKESHQTPELCSGDERAKHYAK
jgi:hypothetical protein